MKTTWREFRLADLAKIEGGGTPSRSEPSFFGGALPWVTPTDLKPIGIITENLSTRETLTDAGLANSSAKRIPSGSVLFSSRATIGKIAITSVDCATNQGFANFTPLEGRVTTDFLAFLLLRYREDIKTLAGRTTFLEVPRGKLKEFKVRIPPIPEQRRIVGRIKECNERIEEIELLRRDAVKESDSLDYAIFADFVESLSKSERSDAFLGDVIQECKYGSSKKASRDGAGIPMLRMGNIQRGQIDVSDLKFVALPREERTKYLLREGDILINRTNSLELVGKSGLFKGLKGDWVYASYLIRLRVDSSKALPEFINAVINSRIGRGYVFRTARRAIGMVNINAEEIKRMPIPLPPIPVQEKLVEKMAEAEPLVLSIRSEFEEDPSTHFRNAILRKAFAGEL